MSQNNSAMSTQWIGPYAMHESSGYEFHTPQWTIRGLSGSVGLTLEDKALATIVTSALNSAYLAGKQEHTDTAWISVEAGYPDERVKVLVAGYNYNDPKRGFWQRTAARFDDHWVEDGEDCSAWDGYPPHFWQPLPSDPPAPPQTPVEP